MDNVCVDTMHIILYTLKIFSYDTGCDSCYGLVQIEVDELRDYRDNLTQLVTQLTRDDVTADLGYFMPRLEATTAQLMQLMGFVIIHLFVLSAVRAPLFICSVYADKI